HCCAASPPPSPRWIVGSATLTTVPSSSTIPEPRIVAASVRRFTEAELRALMPLRYPPPREVPGAWAAPAGLGGDGLRRRKCDHGAGADAVAPLALGLVQRGVSLFADALVVESRFSRRRRDAEAHRDAQAPAHGVALDPEAQALGHRRRLLEAGARQQHQELLAADAVGEIERAQLLAQHVGDVLQDGVSRHMTVGVVDVLEVVEVAHDQPDRLARAARDLRELERAVLQRV